MVARLILLYGWIGSSSSLSSVRSTNVSGEWTEDLGETAGETAGEIAGETAGETAGEIAGETAGETAGEIAGEIALGVDDADILLECFD